MLDYVIGMLFFCAVFLAAFFAYVRIGTARRLEKHQAEWNKMKEKAFNSGLSYNEVEAAYIFYLDDLRAKNKDVLGACFPRF